MKTPTELLRLDSKVALVTGANGGIGPAIARRLSQAGASVALGVHHGSARAEAVVADIVAAGGEASLVAGELGQPDGPPSLVDQVAAGFGRLDIVVNNAALQPVVALRDIGPDEWDAMAAVNLRAVHLLTVAAAEVMIGQGDGGSMVNIGSIEGVQPAPGHGHYATTKAGLAMHGRAAASELGQHGIRVNTVLPGLIDDGEVAGRWPEGVERWNAAAPLGRLGAPDDVADAVVFLASPLARWISGAELVVDGGVLTRPTW